MSAAMQRSLFLVLLLACPALVLAQDTAAATAPTVVLPPDLDRVLRDYEASWQHSDTRGLVGLFAPDGFVLPNGRSPARGYDAIALAYARSGGDLWLRALAYSIADSIGYIVGAYGYGPKPPVPDTGKFVLALRRGADGRWLIAADIDNSNRRSP